MRTLELEQHVSFTGWLPYREVARQLCEADIGVAPYLAMDLFYFDPVKVLDYMAAGLAVVASDQGQIREMLDDGKCGMLVPPDDHDALVEALLKLVKNESLRRQLGEAAHNRAVHTYNWRNTAQQLLDHCSGLVRQTESG